MYIKCHYSQIKKKLHYLERFSKYPPIPNFVKIHPVGAEFFHAEGRMDRRTGMTKPIVTYRNFEDAT
jgi:hypothetical protein